MTYWPLMDVVIIGTCQELLGCIPCGCRGSVDLIIDNGVWARLRLGEVIVLFVRVKGDGFSRWSASAAAVEKASPCQAKGGVEGN